MVIQARYADMITSNSHNNDEGVVMAILQYVGKVFKEIRQSIRPGSKFKPMKQLSSI